MKIGEGFALFISISLSEGASEILATSVIIPLLIKCWYSGL